MLVFSSVFLKFCDCLQQISLPPCSPCTCELLSVPRQASLILHLQAVRPRAWDVPASTHPPHIVQPPVTVRQASEETHKRPLCGRDTVVGGCKRKREERSLTNEQGKETDNTKWGTEEENRRQASRWKHLSYSILPAPFCPDCSNHKRLREKVKVALFWEVSISLMLVLASVFDVSPTTLTMLL